MKNLWALRFVIAMLATFAAAVACFIWVVREYPVYVCAGFVLVIIAAIINRPNVQRQQKRTEALLNDAHRRCYASLPAQPMLVVSSSYGYPAFEISFGSKRDLEAAAAFNSAFKQEIAEIYKSPSWLKGIGPFFRPFSADQAVFFTYKGYLEELSAHSARPNQSPQPTQAFGRAAD